MNAWFAEVSVSDLGAIVTAAGTLGIAAAAWAVFFVQRKLAKTQAAILNIRTAAEMYKFTKELNADEKQSKSERTGVIE